MAKGKKAKLASRKKVDQVSHKDDGSRWMVVRHGRPVYQSHGGTSRAEAERLAAGLVEPAEIVCISAA